MSLHRQTEATPGVWEQHYKAGRTPWRSSGLDLLSQKSLARHSAPPGRLLEIGCGFGDDSAELLELGFDYFGLDCSSTAIRESVCSSRVEFADFFKWHPKSPFDVVYDKGFFHGLAGPKRRRAFVKRLSSILVPNGIWLSVCGAADNRRADFSHGAIYLVDFVKVAEVFFEILEVTKGPYGLANAKYDFEAWFILSRRR